MASEDVIELGSSEEESEPAPKKLKSATKKPMVYIPNNLTELTIAPAKKGPKLNIPIGKRVPVTVNKVVTNPYANEKIPNKKALPIRRGIPIKGNKADGSLETIPKTFLNPIKILPLPAHIRPSGVKPLMARKQTIPQISNLSKLPPGITITKTRPNIIRMKPTQPKTNIKRKMPMVANVANFLTVEIDDEEPAVSASGPQWYLRPEDQKNKTLEKDPKQDTKEEPKDENASKEKDDQTPKSAEVQNNKEPEPNYIEITIEDSPVKPKSKRTHEVGVELAITIEDSPVKNTESQDDSSDHEHTGKKQKKSKKKLGYPKDVLKCIEIELEPLASINGTEKDQEASEYHVIEIEASPAKVEEFHSSTPKNKKNNQTTKEKPHFKGMEEIQKDNGEYHPIYQDFIDLCLELENSNDMMKIVDKKIKAYYKQVPKDYAESEAFLDMVSGKLTAMKACPEKMYLYIKDVVDELNLQRKLAKSQVIEEEKAKEEEKEKYLYGEESEFDSKRQRQIRKLEKTIKKLHRAIQKLEEQEVDFDDEDDSVYLLTERYKERMVRVHAKFCQLTNTKMPSEPRVHIDPRPGQPKGPARLLEKWINKKVPIGIPLPFPDFHDVLKCVRDANQEDRLGWNEADIMEEARDLFVRCGRKLQRRRQENEWRLAASRVGAEVDPAEDNDELRKSLDANRSVASKRETDVLNKYADRQNQLNLEPIEIADKDADESPVESDDDDPGESTLLADKELRKERLKRLLQEKSNKNSQKVNKEKKEVNDQEKSDAENPKESEDAQADDDKPGCSKSNNNKSDDDSKIHSLSDDSNNLNSDIDELNLLQKLHSEKEESSSTQHSGSESPNSTSDSLAPSDEEKNDNEVISIENSSYSESEERRDNVSIILEDNSQETKKEESNDKEITPQKKGSYKKVTSPNKGTGTEVTSVTVQTNNVKANTSSGEAKKHVSNNNEECNQSIEDILLASTDDEAEDKNDKELQKSQPNDNNRSSKENSKIDKTDSELNETKGNSDSLKCNGATNLRDDDISIGETVVEGSENMKVTNTANTSSVQAMDTDEIPDSNVDSNLGVVKNTEHKESAIDNEKVNDSKNDNEIKSNNIEPMIVDSEEV